MAGEERRAIGSRSTFDWIFMSAAVAGVWVAAGALSSINNKIETRMTRAEMTAWTVNFASMNAGSSLKVPIYLPPSESKTEEKR